MSVRLPVWRYSASSSAAGCSGTTTGAGVDMGCSDAVVATLATTVLSTLADLSNSQAEAPEVDRPRTAASRSDFVMIVILRNRLDGGRVPEVAQGTNHALRERVSVHGGNGIAVLTQQLDQAVGSGKMQRTHRYEGVALVEYRRRF